MRLSTLLLSWCFLALFLVSFVRSSSLAKKTSPASPPTKRSHLLAAAGAGPVSDHDDDFDFDEAVDEVPATSVINQNTGLRCHPLTKFGLAIAGIGEDYRVDYRGILNKDGIGELLLAMVYPARIIRSALLAWVVTEVWDNWGYRYFFRGGRGTPKARRRYYRSRSNNDPENTKVYKRVTTKMTMPWNAKKTVYEGIVPPSPEPEEFQNSRRTKTGGSSSSSLAAAPSSSSAPKKRRSAPSSSKQKVFDNIIPESHETTNLLSKSDREQTLKGYEVNTKKKSKIPKQQPRSSSRRRQPTNSKKLLTRTKKRIRKFFRMTRKKKFAIAWYLGHILAPMLWLVPIGGWSMGGWIGMLCAGAHLVDRFDVEDNELTGLIKPFQSDRVKTFLFGSVVGAMMTL